LDQRLAQSSGRNLEPNSEKNSVLYSVPN